MADDEFPLFPAAASLSSAASDPSTLTEDSTTEQLDNKPAAIWPTVFVSHGAPTLSLAPGETGECWSTLGARWLERFGAPRCVLVISPHWVSPGLRLTGSESPPTVHDFYGFPSELYELDYPAPGAPDIARDIQTLLATYGISAQVDPQRGLDHGAWVPLQFLFPSAHIPVVQLSLIYPDSASNYFQLGRVLQTLCTQKVMVLASGSMTHNLYEFRGQATDAPVQPYVNEFRDWMFQTLAQGDLKALFDYRSLAPHALRAHPEDDHLVPLFIAMGAADTLGFARLNDTVTYGILGMDTLVFGSQAKQLI